MDNYPEPNVLPRAADDEETARTLSKVIPAVLEQCNYEQVYSDTWWRKLKTGTGVKGIFWDPVLRGGLGDISIQSVNLLMLYWAPGVEDIQQSPHLFSLSLEDNEQLVGRFPQMEGHTGKGLDVGQYIHDDSIDTTDKSVVVDWYYKKAQPSGQTVLHYCKYCNGVVLYASENDPQLAQRGFYDHGKYPFVFDPLFMEEDSPAGFGFIDVMKDTQTAIDEMNHAMDENVKLAAKQRFVLSDTAGVNEKELADFSKDIVHMVGRLNSDSFMPLQTNVLSGNCMNYRDARVSELKEVSGNRDVSQGGTTSGLTAASAIAALQEAGSKLSRDMLKSAYRAFAKECYLIIELMRQFYDEQRVYRITGESGGVEYATFSAQMLRGVPGGVVGGVQLGDHEPVFDIVDGKMNLQLFADGNAGGSAAAGEGGAEAAPVVQEPALRPAQERLARRSGALLRGKASPAEQPPQLSGQPETQLQEGEKPTEEKPEKTPEEKRKAFGALVRDGGEYSDIFNEVMQQAIIKAGEAVHADPKAAALRQALSEAYGVDGEDVDGLIEAVKNGKVKDEAYYEELAQQRGVSVKTARELDKMESDLRRANDQNAKLQAAQQEAARQQRAAQIRAQWDAQAAQLKAQYPDFDLGEVLANEQVGELMRRGVSLPDAYRAAYFNHIMEQATARTAQTVEQGVTARIQQRAARPGENGTRPGGAATTKFDISNTTRRQREELERRARRGEKIVL